MLGPDPWPYTYAENRATWETLLQYAHEQGLIAMAERYEDQVALDEEHMRLIRESLLEATPNPTSQLIEIQRALESDRSEVPPSTHGDAGDR